MDEITQGTLINLDGKTWSLNLHCVGETEGSIAMNRADRIITKDMVRQVRSIVGVNQREWSDLQIEEYLKAFCGPRPA